MNDLSDIVGFGDWAEDDPRLDSLRFPGTDLTLREAREQVKQDSAPVRHRDPRICICGHPMRGHMPSSRGQEICKPTKMECPCRLGEPALLATDTRHFLRITSGRGAQHALMKGVLKTTLAGRSVEWLDGVRACRICGAKEGEIESENGEDTLVMCAVTSSGFIASSPQKMNGFLCRPCVSRLGVISA